MYKDKDLLCPFCSKTDDTQQHMLECAVLKQHLKSTEISQHKIVYEDIFKDIKKQKEITALYKLLLDIRRKLKGESQLSQLNPCISSQVLRNGLDLRNCIDNYSSGK